jgi:hypothetical protein
MLFVRAVHTIRFAITFSSPMDTQDRSVISRYEYTEVLSLIPSLGSITTSASFYDFGKRSSARQPIRDPMNRILNLLPVDL